MFSIGEFSKITGLTVKTLRFYHEEGLLIPKAVDRDNGYRYYDETQIEAARAISVLRGLDLSLADVKQLLASQLEDEALVAVLERHKSELEEKVKHHRAALRSLNGFLAEQRRAMERKPEAVAIHEKTLEPLLIAGIRMQGRYSDCGKAFGKIGRALGRHVCGPPLLLHYDNEFKEDGADFEVCMPIRHSRAIAGISVRELPGCHAVSLVHQGPYDELGPTYGKALRYAKEKGFEIVMPTREVCLRGPGMFLRGNPRKYLTEVLLPVV